jgi:hypothetical protein
VPVEFNFAFGKYRQMRGLIGQRRGFRRPSVGRSSS